MNPPDEDLPHKQFSLAEFLQVADVLLYKKDFDGFIRFILAGCYSAVPDGPMLRVFVNAKQGLHTGLPDADLVVTRDYDSVIGMSNNLLYMAVLQVFSVAPFQSTLKKNNHMRGLAYDSKVRIFHPAVRCTP